MTGIRTKPATRRRCEDNDALVLTILRDINRPLSAYEIAHRASLIGASIAAAQAYRTLGRLMQRGVVRRIKMLNAYIYVREGANLCLICISCHAVEFMSVPDLGSSLGTNASERRFEIADKVIEAQGTCQECRL